MKWLHRFMAGRYGVDHLSLGLILISIPLSIITLFINKPLLSSLTYIPLFIAYYRIFSRNIYKRREENSKFLKAWMPIYLWGTKKIERLKGRKTHKYYKCPNCSQLLRVPKGRGNIRITCPKCKCEFKRKS